MLSYIFIEPHTLRDGPDMLFLFFKAFTTPLLILGAALASRRWGPVIGGGFAGLPFISGPASLFIAIQYGTSFAAGAASGSLLGAVASCCYCLAYAHSARRFGWAPSLCIALAVFFASAFLLTKAPYSLPVASLLGVGVPVVCLLLLPDVPGSVDMRRVQPPWRLPVQMLCGGLSVLALTELAGVVGEQWSGILLTFPIISSILTPFAHLAFGARAAVLTIRGLLVGFIGTSCFIIIIAAGLEPLGIAAGYCVAALGALLTSFLIMFQLNKKR